MVQPGQALSPVDWDRILRTSPVLEPSPIILYTRHCKMKERGGERAEAISLFAPNLTAVRVIKPAPSRDRNHCFVELEGIPIML